MVGGYKKFLETSGLQSDLSNLNIRQIIKLKNLCKKNLELYHILFSSHKKRQAYTKYIRATIRACHEIQSQRRSQAVDYYYSLPPENRTKKNWIKYTALFSHSGKGYKQSQENVTQ